MAIKQVEMTVELRSWSLGEELSKCEKNCEGGRAHRYIYMLRNDITAIMIEI